MGNADDISTDWEGVDNDNAHNDDDDDNVDNDVDNHDYDDNKFTIKMKSTQNEVDVNKIDRTNTHTANLPNNATNPDQLVWYRLHTFAYTFMPASKYEAYHLVVDATSCRSIDGFTRF